MTDNEKIMKEKYEELKTFVNDRIRDDETWHYMEDYIHVMALKIIAGKSDNPDKIAKIALKTLKLEFSRWYA